MPLDDDKYKKYTINNEEEHEGSSGSSTGSASGQIEFRDFLASGQSRDDLLSVEELNRLLSVHQDVHEFNIKKQKDLREQRKALKEGKTNLQDYRQGVGQGMHSEYRMHPALADKAQFSGIERQVNMLPNENVAETNQANRNELELQYRLRHTPENTPRFNPKPQFNR